MKDKCFKGMSGAYTAMFTPIDAKNRINEEAIDQMIEFGISNGRTRLPLLYGIFMKRVNGFGAMCGLVANYIICFGLDRLTFVSKPHLLLFCFLGMVACLVVAPIASFARTVLRDKRTI